MNIYCGNISFRATSQDIEKLFESFGEVSSARVITDRETGRSRGFAIVEMDDDSQAQQAIDSLNGNDFMGRNLVVNEARRKS
ncbi:MAG: RNA recognition motif domain-containing protein [Bacteroidota bacterium]